MRFFKCKKSKLFEVGLTESQVKYFACHCGAIHHDIFIVKILGYLRFHRLIPTSVDHLRLYDEILEYATQVYKERCDPKCKSQGQLYTGAKYWADKLYMQYLKEQMLHPRYHHTEHYQLTPEIIEEFLRQRRVMWDFYDEHVKHLNEL